MERLYLLGLPVIMIALGIAGGIAGVTLAYTTGSHCLPSIACVACGALVGQNIVAFQEAWKYR